MNKNLSKKILSKIKSQKIIPKPKWKFLFKNYLIWSCVFLFLLIGGLSFSVIIYLFKNNDWSIYSQISNSLLEFVLLTMPYFWILLIIIFITIANYNIKKTKKGYRYSIYKIAILSIISSIFFGVIFFQTGLGRVIDDVLGEKAPFYEKVFNRQIKHWLQPEKGRLTGIVMSQINEQEFLLVDIKSNEWKVVLIDDNIKFKDELKIGFPVKIIGKKIKENLFEAEKIMPVGPGKKFLKRKKHKEFNKTNKPVKSKEYFEKNIKLEERPDRLSPILEKFPDFKKLFEESLLENKKNIQEIIQKNPDFPKYLENLKISSTTLKALN